MFESRSDRNITFRTLGAGFVNVLTDQKLVLLSTARGRTGGGALAALEDLVRLYVMGLTSLLVGYDQCLFLNKVA